jgi:quercetin dioxygenase-like cupin family protein
MSYPQTTMACVSNLWIRMMTFAKAGDKNEGHSHDYDHITLLSKGRVRVSVDGQLTEFTAPHLIFIAKGKSHYIEALEDNTVASCIHALRTGVREEDIVDPSMVPAGVVFPFGGDTGICSL